MRAWAIFGLVFCFFLYFSYAHYITSYVLTFESQEKIIVAPYRSPDRYPAHAKYVDQLAEAFQQALKQNKILHEKIKVEPFWVFVVNRRAGTEKGVV